MSDVEYLPHIRMHESSETEWGRVYALRHEIDHQAIHPPGKDPIISNFFNAVRQEIESDEAFAKLIFQFAQFRKVTSKGQSTAYQENGATASEAAGMLRVALQTDAFEHDPEFPNSWESVAAIRRYLASIPRVMQEGGERGEQLTLRFYGENVLTTIPSRDGPVELGMQALRPRFMREQGKGIVWYNVGGGALLAEKQLTNKEQHPLRPILTDNPEMTARVNRLNAMPSLIDSCVSLDIQAYDHNTSHAARGALRPVKEMSDTVFMQEFNALDHAPLDRVKPFVCDLSDPKDLQRLDRAFPDLRPHFVSLVTSAHQIHREGVLGPVLQAIRERIHPEGIIWLQDFAWTHPRHPQSLQFYKHWHQDWRYRVYAADMQSPHPEQWQHLLSCRDSRALEITFGAGRLMLNGRFMTMPELILEATGKDSDAYPTEPKLRQRSGYTAP